MDHYKQLAEQLRSLSTTSLSIYQGIVTQVEGHLCHVQVGSIVLPDVRLRASALPIEGECLITPQIGSAVIIGSLSGDLSDLAVLAVDRIESIRINGGEKGGLINIQSLTEVLNRLIDTFNSHTHPTPAGPSSTPTVPAKAFQREDYEDPTITH